MKKIIYMLVSLLSLAAWSGVEYYGAVSTEAILTFEGKIEVDTDKPLTVAQLNGRSARAQEIKDIVDYQLTFLIGHFHSESFQNKFGYPGVLGDSQTVTFTGVSEVKKNRQILTYNYEGKTNFHSEAFGRKKNITVPLRIPLDPYQIYNLGLVGDVNKCTDHHYNSEGDMFYFWDPEMRGCPLKKNKKAVVQIEGNLEKLENTNSTYPEYERLYKSDELKISVMFGYIDDYPEESGVNDDGYLAYAAVIKELKKLGFTVAEEKNFKKLNNLTRLEKTVLNQLGMHQKVSVTLLISDAAVGIADNTFEKYYKDALFDAQIIAYDGHSGLGGNLDLARFSVDKLNSNYQIMFFNGCSSYPYFNSMYFNAKPGGTKNLEIITSGMSTLTSTSLGNMMAFLDPFVKGKTYSYQTLMKGLEKSNGDEGTYLMGVNGDEDNMFSPGNQ